MNEQNISYQITTKYYENVNKNILKEYIFYIHAHPTSSLKFNDKEVEYLSCGKGNRTILSFHGALGNAILNYKAIKLFENSYRVIAPSITDFKNLDEFCLAVNKIIKHEKVEKFILIGQSFGSFIAQAYFHRYFKRIEGLIIVNSYPPKKEWVKNFRRMARLLKIVPVRLLRKIFSKELFKLVDETKEMSMEKREDLALTTSMMRERLGNVKKSVIINQIALMGDFNNELYNIKDYSDWRGKVLIFTANDDGGFPYHDILKSQYPNVREVIFKDVGHMGTLLNREDFHSNLDKFLKSTIKRNLNID